MIRSSAAAARAERATCDVRGPGIGPVGDDRGRDRGPAWSVLEDRERYRMLKYLYVGPSTFLVLLIGRGVAAAWPAGRWGRRRARVRGALPGPAGSTSRRSTGRCSSRRCAGHRRRSWRSACSSPRSCLQTRQESWSYPEAFAGALFLLSGVVFPLAVLPDALEGLGLLNPMTWWVEGVRRALLPGSPTVDRRRGLAVDRRHRNRRAGRRHDLARLVRDRGARYTRRDRHLPVERASRRERGLLDRTTGS